MSSFRNFITSPKMVLTTVVWAGAFKVSASHAVSTAMEYGNGRDDAMTYPLLIDALIVGCALWVASPKGVNKATRMWAGFGRLFGFVATLGTNLAHSDLTGHGTSILAIATTAFVSLLPGIAVIVMTEVFVHGMKSTPAARKASAAKTVGRGNVVPMRKAS
jgi:hypothetical protein